MIRTSEKTIDHCSLFTIHFDNDWYGVGWITLDKDKAFGDYIIKGGLQGGMTTKRYLPLLTILSPKDGKYYKLNKPLVCSGSAYEKIPGAEGPGKDLSDNINWEIQGPDEHSIFGGGKEITFKPWMYGDYRIFADVTDTQGNETLQMVEIKVGLGERYNRYDEIIINATKGTDILPEIEKGKIHQESVFFPYAVSEVGAMGISQFMPDTAKEVGLTTPMPPLPSGTPANSKELYAKRKEFYAWVKTEKGKAWANSPAVDGSVWDPDAAIPAGVDYLQKRYDYHGWESGLERQRYALAGYNAGSGNVNKWQRNAMEWYAKENDLKFDSNNADIREFGTHWINLVKHGGREVDPKTDKVIVGTPLKVKQTIDYVEYIMGSSGNELQGFALEYDP